MIYIDPPYNTGAEFVYADHFEYTDDELCNMLGMNDTQIKRLHSINGKSSHSAWLTFMYPRLRLAKELLKESGVIFISIDDNEQANLRLLCDEVFGEGNFVECLIWKKRATPPNDRNIGRIHEFVLVYVKNIDSIYLGLLARDDRSLARYSNPDNDPRGPWVASDLSANGKGGRIVPSCIYPIKNPYNGKEYSPSEGRCWLFNRSKADEWVKNGRIAFRENTGAPFLKRYLSEVKQGLSLPTIMTEFGFSQTSAMEVDELFGKKGIFEYAKPTTLLKPLIRVGAPSPDSLILDFFAGSGTTAHAVMRLNAEDGGKRQWILAQLDESTPLGSEARRAGYNTIDQIAMARIQKVASSLALPMYKDMDLGYRHYTIKPLPSNTIDQITAFDPSSEYKAEEWFMANFTDGLGGKEAVLCTFMLSDGVKLTDKAEYLNLSGYSAPLEGGTVYIIEEGWSTEQTAALLNLIGKRERVINAVVLWGYAGLDFAAVKELELGVRQAFGEGDVRVLFNIRW